MGSSILMGVFSNADLQLQDEWKVNLCTVDTSLSEKRCGMMSVWLHCSAQHDQYSTFRWVMFSAIYSFHSCGHQRLACFTSPCLCTLKCRCFLYKEVCIQFLKCWNTKHTNQRAQFQSIAGYEEKQTICWHLLPTFQNARQAEQNYVWTRGFVFVSSLNTRIHKLHDIMSRIYAIFFHLWAIYACSPFLCVLQQPFSLICSVSLPIFSPSSEIFIHGDLQWDIFQVIISRSTTPDLIKIGMKLQEFFTQQFDTSKRALSTWGPGPYLPPKTPVVNTDKGAAELCKHASFHTAGWMLSTACSIIRRAQQAS